MASKKDYVSMARILAPMVQALGKSGLESYSVAYEAVHRIADLYADDNPRFDRAKFLTACGITQP